MDLKNKIELHGKSLRKDTIFSLFRTGVVIVALFIFMKAEVETYMYIFIAAYAVFAVLSARRKMKKEAKFYTFAPGNPTYDELQSFGVPEQIVEAINQEVNEGKVLYSTLAKPNKTPIETLITENYFVHMNKRTTVIPLKNIVIAYMYDNATRISPTPKFLPTYFKPIYLIIAYSLTNESGKEKIIIYSEVAYQDILDVLDQRLGCRVSYTRELGTLFNSDYGMFLTKAEEAKRLFHEPTAPGGALEGSR